MLGLCGEWGVLLPIPATKTHLSFFVNIIQPDPWAVFSNPESTLKHLNSSNNTISHVPGVSLWG